MRRFQGEYRRNARLGETYVRYLERELAKARKDKPLWQWTKRELRRVRGGKR